MKVAYCDLEDVKFSLSGDVPNLGASHDQSLVSKIVESSRDLDRLVSKCRGDDDSTFSFLAEQLYGRQKIYMSSAPRPTSGTFLLSFSGQVTTSIAYNAIGSVVQSALEALSTIGAGNVAVDGFAGGPWTVDFAGTLVGPQPEIKGQSQTNVDDASIVVLPVIDGVPALNIERFYSATPDAYGKIIPIDDCVSIEAVNIYSDSGADATSVYEPADYRRYPMRGTPIQGLKSTGADWPVWPGTVGVKARWGHRDSIPTDVREGVVIETIRAHFAALAGNDDRLGMTPFGKVVTSKAFSSKFWQLAEDYGHSKLW